MLETIHRIQRAKVSMENVAFHITCFSLLVPPMAQASVCMRINS